MFETAFNQLLHEVENVIKGKRDQVAMALVCLLAEGHLLLEDVPGTGKTVLSKALADAIGGSFSRIQFTPDLLPSDVTGGLVYHQGEGRFELHRGPVFANVVVADEINRASPKTQAALLEVMEERQVTIGHDSNLVPRPFVVIATQNPVGQAGTYQLPEAQLDRFLMRTSLGYPDEDAEVAVLAGSGRSTTTAVTDPLAIQRLIGQAASVHADPRIQRYIVRLAAATRDLDEVRLGVSTRGAVGLLRAARSMAACCGRDFVTSDDVKAVAPPVMLHRLLLTADAELKQVSVAALVDRVLDTVEVPTGVPV